MTARCHGATSSAKPGFGETVYIAPAAIGALLNNAPTPWAVVLAGYIGAVTYNLSVFCVNDPPAVPTFTAADVVALLNPYNPLPFTDAQDKFQDLIGALTWNDLCQCNDASVPIAPVPPTQPTGMPNINPPSVSPNYPTGVSCSSYSFGSVHFTGTVTGPTVTFPVGDVTYGVLDIVQRSRPTAGSDNIAYYLRCYNSSGTQVAIAAVGLNTTADTLHAEVAFPASTATYTLFYADTVGLAGPIDVEVVATFYCGGATPGGPSGGYPAPCPTDPFTLALLDQILALVTLTQRQAAPFAYVASSAHSGLTGSGHLDVQGLLGVKVQLDSYGSAVGVESGDPAEFFEAGWIVWQNADGGTTREHITHSPFISLPDLAGQFTRIGYTLGEGVSATITELVREP